jgi:hypothetical protein
MRPLQDARNAGPGSLTIGLIGLVVLILATVFPIELLAQSEGATRLTGSFGTGTTPAGHYQVAATFTCDFASGAAGPCSGTFAMAERDENCTNTLQLGGNATITGLDLSRTGPIQGTLTATIVDYQITPKPDGSCTFTFTSPVGKDIPFTGTWNGTSGNFAFPPGMDSHGLPINITGTFKAESTPPPPVFPMTVTSSITATSATAAADIQFRPQDVGTSGSTFTFAVAPSTLVKGGQEKSATVIGTALSLEKADAPTCVLAQLSSTGQLVAVTYAQLQAYSSGTLSAQGASVTILNNASTPAVAGSTFYVGYGASNTAMINEGVYRNAITVPGASVCPMLSSQTALWWNPAESGWGLNLNHQGNIVFATLFTYDANRAPLWLVMSNGAMQSDGLTFTGDLYRTTGPAFNTVPFTGVGVSTVGSMTVSFVDVNSGALRYTFNGVEVNKGIQRQVYGTRAAACFPTYGSRAAATNYQDLWWNPAESGWGINITHQDNILFATLFTYDATGRDLWLVMSNGQRQSDGSYQGDLYRTSGPAFSTVPFTGVTVATVGSMRLRFSDGNNGTLTYIYNGVSVTKSITRQLFSSPVPACN